MNVRLACVVSSMVFVLAGHGEAQQTVPFRNNIPVAPLGIAAIPPLPDKPVVYHTAEGQDIRVVVVARGLSHPWSLAFLPDGRPAGLMALAAVTLTCLLVALLAQGARLAAVVTAAPQRSGVAALREKSWRAGFVSQRDPDAPGRARPRAPTAGPAAA